MALPPPVLLVAMRVCKVADASTSPRPALAHTHPLVLAICTIYIFIYLRPIIDQLINRVLINPLVK